MKTESFLDLTQPRIRIKISLDLQYMPKIDWSGEIIGKSPNWLLKPDHKFIKSVIKINSKMRKYLIYNEV